jgi:hypothetical protein
MQFSRPSRYVPPRDHFFLITICSDCFATTWLQNSRILRTEQSFVECDVECYRDNARVVRALSIYLALVPDIMNIWDLLPTAKQKKSNRNIRFPYKSKRKFSVTTLTISI